MLRNELKVIEELLLNPEFSTSSAITEIGLQSQIRQICQTWEKAVFSDMPEHSLVRYFSFHLESLSRISDIVYGWPDNDRGKYLQSELLGLIDHLNQHYKIYLNHGIYAPLAYQQRLMQQLEESLGLIEKGLHTAGISPGLKKCITQWINDMIRRDGDERISFRSLAYFHQLIVRLKHVAYTSNFAEHSLVTLLARSNFNHLGFFVYRQEASIYELNQFKDYREKLRFLQQIKAEVASCPEETELAYDPHWPSLKTMMRDWLQEQLYLAEADLKKEKELQPQTTLKLPVKLSVAHLACLVRLLFEESIFGTENLKLIFKCFAGNYQTKRQTVISAGSLSKEYYSIDQHTAARVRDLLQKMVSRINRDFFPVVAAISITALASPGMH